MKALAILLCLSAMILSGAAEDVMALTVVGDGRVLVPADVVYVSVSSTSTDENLTRASLYSTEVLNRTIEALIYAGLDKFDFQTGRDRSVSSTQTMSRVCNNSSCVMVAEEAVISVKERVTIRFEAKDEDLINRTLEVAEAEGAEASIIGYALEDRSAAFAEARKMAIQNAKDVAESLASAAGMKLDKRLEIIERSSPVVRQIPLDPYPMRYRMMDFFDLFWDKQYDPFDAAIYPEPGMMEVRSRVFVTYEVTS
ncbi:SIMPL domain-containing protein [Candidatus Methanocrinis natronophilus]|uniref:SIMPL domain-containing protein n=1 Tax=Candidatus Methanocrinis natronophilus TaxID=3033396 RepID=A0ABT5X5F8_9EURY|nr:SIMPL domain-containing protein [Candidatus Methanocrinis natronophilus]MDF0589927.1 SIMPL domain-containing protein [Candidatus Methanocrinis natronophilus]